MENKDPTKTSLSTNIEPIKDNNELLKASETETATKESNSINKEVIHEDDLFGGPGTSTAAQKDPVINTQSKEVDLGVSETKDLDADPVEGNYDLIKSVSFEVESPKKTEEKSEKEKVEESEKKNLMDDKKNDGISNLAKLRTLRNDSQTKIAEKVDIKQRTDIYNNDFPNTSAKIFAKKTREKQLLRDKRNKEKDSANDDVIGSDKGTDNNIGRGSGQTMNPKTENPASDPSKGSGSDTADKKDKEKSSEQENKTESTNSAKKDGKSKSKSAVKDCDCSSWILNSLLSLAFLLLL